MQTALSPSFSISSMEGLIRKLESLKDPEARATAAELMRTVLGFHHRALEQIVKELNKVQFGPQFIQQIAVNPVVSNLLLLYGFHPLDLEARVRAGLQRVESYWRSAGYELEILEIADGNLHIQFQQPRPGSGSTSALRSLVENAIYNAAPDIEDLMIGGLA